MLIWIFFISSLPGRKKCWGQIERRVFNGVIGQCGRAYWEVWDEKW